MGPEGFAGGGEIAERLGLALLIKLRAPGGLLHQPTHWLEKRADRVYTDADPVAVGRNGMFVQYGAGRFEFLNQAKDIRVKGDADDDRPRRRLRPAEVRAAQARPKPLLEDVLKALEESEHDHADALRGLEAARVDLVQAYKEGLPPIEPLPGSSGIIMRGKRHAMAAPAKEGKSIGALVLNVDMALAGVRVLILDRENGADVYAERLEGIVKARGLTTRDERTLREHLWYYEFPDINSSTGRALTLMSDLANADLVLFDSQRMMLADMGLAEDDSDDYSRFMNRVIDPVFQRGTATWVLDNTGHEEKGRPRGTTAKLDLHDVVLNARTTKKFGREQRGEIEVHTTHTRLGNWGAWRLGIGGGYVGRWLQEGQTDMSVLAEHVEPILRGRREPMPRNQLIAELRSNGYRGRQKTLRAELRALADHQGYSLRAVEGEGYSWPQ